MNIYFTASLSAKGKSVAHDIKIITYLRELGHIVYSRYVTEETKENVKEPFSTHHLDMPADVEHWIKNCDFLIADTSHPSVSVGYEISQALQLSKPVLVFYDKSGPPSLLDYDKDGRIMPIKYNNKTYKKDINSFIFSIRTKLDVRFLFIITSEIAQFLDKISHKEKISKAVYVRKLIEEDMKTHSFS